MFVVYNLSRTVLITSFKSTIYLYFTLNTIILANIHAILKSVHIINSYKINSSMFSQVQYGIYLI